MIISSFSFAIFLLLHMNVFSFAKYFPPSPLLFFFSSAKKYFLPFPFAFTSPSQNKFFSYTNISPFSFSVFLLLLKKYLPSPCYFPPFPYLILFSSTKKHSPFSVFFSTKIFLPQILSSVNFSKYFPPFPFAFFISKSKCHEVQCPHSILLTNNLVYLKSGLF